VIVEELSGLAGVSDVLLLVRGLLDADGHADDEGDGDERDPAPDGLLAVLGAPAAHPRGERLGMHSSCS
jgi:hypothetical protein